MRLSEDDGDRIPVCSTNLPPDVSSILQVSVKTENDGVGSLFVSEQEEHSPGQRLLSPVSKVIPSDGFNA